MLRAGSTGRGCYVDEEGSRCDEPGLQAVVYPGLQYMLQYPINGFLRLSTLGRSGAGPLVH